MGQYQSTSEEGSVGQAHIDTFNRSQESLDKAARIVTSSALDSPWTAAPHTATPTSSMHQGMHCATPPEVREDGGASGKGDKGRKKGGDLKGVSIRAAIDSYIENCLSQPNDLPTSDGRAPSQASTTSGDTASGRVKDEEEKPKTPETKSVGSSHKQPSVEEDKSSVGEPDGLTQNSNSDRTNQKDISLKNICKPSGSNGAQSSLDDVESSASDVKIERPHSNSNSQLEASSKAVEDIPVSAIFTSLSKSGSGNSSSPIIVLDDPSKPVTSGPQPVTSAPNSAGPATLQDFIENVLDKSLHDPSSPLPHSKSASQDSSSLERSKRMSSNGEQEKQLAKQEFVKKGGILSFKDQIEQVITNCVRYEDEGQRDVKGSANSVDSVKPNRSDFSLDRGDLTKKEVVLKKSVPDGTISVQDLVDRVISETEVVSKMNLPSDVVKASSSGKGSDFNRLSPLSGQHMSKPNRSLMEQQRHTVHREYQSSTMGRRRGRPRLGSPIHSGGDGEEAKLKAAGYHGNHHGPRTMDYNRGAPRHASEMSRGPPTYPRAPQGPPPPLDFAPPRVHPARHVGPGPDGSLPRGAPLPPSPPGPPERAPPAGPLQQGSLI